MPIPRGVVSKQRSLAAKLRRTKNSKPSNVNKFALIGKQAIANGKQSNGNQLPEEQQQ
jgi:hypothetical protein